MRCLNTICACLALTICVSGATPAQQAAPPKKSADEMSRVFSDPASNPWLPYRLDLAPAKWIWFPSQRTIPNTFVLFRREVELPAAPKSAAGWIGADSRYRLTVNGKRIQWGPAPCDPRWLDVDPVNLLGKLKPGRNVIGVEVLYYGVGDGTWAGGKPGLIFNLDLEHADGRRERILSDESWNAFLDRAHPPGRPKRWYLRALQEHFDARLHSYGWDAPGFQMSDRWVKAMPIPNRPDNPASSSAYPDYAGDQRTNPQETQLRARQIPLMRETEVPALRLAEQGRVKWSRDPADWFQFRTPGSFRITREEIAKKKGDGWELPATPDPSDAVFLTFEFREQIVGWPRFTIDAPAGTIVELIPQESHDPARTAWLDTHFFNWSRFICREGENRFEEFDFECLRWLQLHVRSASRPVTVSGVGMRRRIYDWPNKPRIRVSDPPLQKLLDASLNTLHNCAQETIVDGMGRERQQYSGDCGHQLHAIRSAFGETRQPRRYLRTFSEGMTIDGYFLDCWPGTDRLERLMQRQVGATMWGPLLDHGVGFNFDCWNHYLETGDVEALKEPYPRLLKFARYLESIRRGDGLLPVEDIGVPTVWIDHLAYKSQRHKHCAFNLYAAAMFRHALAPIARLFGDDDKAGKFEKLGDELLAAVVRGYWSAEHGTFVNNLPWLKEEKEPRFCDRSLGTALMFGQCPGGDVAASLRLLAAPTPQVGISYPANACWRYWALAKHGRVDVVLQEFRGRWARMESVLRNNTLQEMWEAIPDSPVQWSHCPVVPLYMFYMDIAGIRPAAPGYAKCAVEPKLGDLRELELTAYTVRGPVGFKARKVGDDHEVILTLPEGCEGELRLPGGKTGRLPAGQTHIFRVPGAE